MPTVDLNGVVTDLELDLSGMHKNSILRDGLSRLNGLGDTPAAFRNEVDAFSRQAGCLVIRAFDSGNEAELAAER